MWGKCFGKKKGKKGRAGLVSWKKSFRSCARSTTREKARGSIFKGCFAGRGEVRGKLRSLTRKEKLTNATTGVFSLKNEEN